MTNNGSDIQSAVEHLRSQVELCKKDALDFSKRHFNGVREDSLVYCLQRAVDIAQGCAMTADASLPNSLHTLTRSLYEGLIWTRWVMLSEANANTFDADVKNELKRLATNVVRKGYGKFIDKTTKQDKSPEFLVSDEINNVPKRLRIADMAKESGFDRVHTEAYGFYSMFAHGNAVRLTSAEEIKEGVSASAVAAIGFLKCIHLIVKNWIVLRKETPWEEISRILE